MSIQPQVKKTLLLLTTVLLVLTSISPAAAQWFYRIGHVAKSSTKKAEHANKSLRHREKRKSKKRNPDHAERRRHREAQRQEKRRAEGPRQLQSPAATAPEPEKPMP